MTSQTSTTSPATALTSGSGSEHLCDDACKHVADVETCDKTRKANAKGADVCVSNSHVDAAAENCSDLDTPTSASDAAARNYPVTVDAAGVVAKTYKSYSVCDAEMASVAQLLDVVHDLERAHTAFEKVERERLSEELHNILET